uniref:Uncharacterized protein n=1 Tax=Romanomermis culicivorax TaxID=13658 RepID=A0A915KCA4_ROMCU
MQIINLLFIHLTPCVCGTIFTDKKSSVKIFGPFSVVLDVEFFVLNAKSAGEKAAKPVYKAAPPGELYLYSDSELVVTFRRLAIKYSKQTAHIVTKNMQVPEVEKASSVYGFSRKKQTNKQIYLSARSITITHPFLGAGSEILQRESRSVLDALTGPVTTLSFDSRDHGRFTIYKICRLYALILMVGRYANTCEAKKSTCVIVDFFEELQILSESVYGQGDWKPVKVNTFMDKKATYNRPRIKIDRGVTAPAERANNIKMTRMVNGQSQLSGFGAIVVCREKWLVQEKIQERCRDDGPDKAMKNGSFPCQTKRQSSLTFEGQKAPKRRSLVFVKTMTFKILAKGRRLIKVLTCASITSLSAISTTGGKLDPLEQTVFVKACFSYLCLLDSPNFRNDSDDLLDLIEKSSIANSYYS